MPITPTLPAAILETILASIATLFLAGAGGDATLARQAAIELLADYRAQTADELSLAATIISCSFRSLDILVQAAAKDLPVALMLRLHGSAVSLSREAAKAQRLLAQLQKQRKQAHPAPSIEPVQQAEPAPIQPQHAPAPQPAQATPARPLGPIAQFAKDRGLSWSKAYKEREREMRLAARIQRAEAKAATAATSATPVPA